MFGKMTGLFLLAKVNASSKSMSFSCIRYAMTQVADLDTPAWQWTSTPPPFCMPSLMKAMAAGKWRKRLWFELSSTLIILYLKS